MTITDISVCNSALIKLKAKTITDFEDNNSRATICGIEYPILRNALLTSHRWNFNTGKRQLVQLSIPPLNEWDFAYQLPTNRLGNPSALYNSTQPGTASVVDFEIQRDKLLTNARIMVIDYQFDLEEAAWPPDFLDFVTAALAARIGEAVTGQRTLAREWFEVAYGPPSAEGRGGLFQAVRNRDSQGAGTEEVQDFQFISARFG